MVGGPVVNGKEDYEHHPFNLATEGHRQPGSAFKPFTLAVALESGYGPSSLMTIMWTLFFSSAKGSCSCDGLGPDEIRSWSSMGYLCLPSEEPFA